MPLKYLKGAQEEILLNIKSRVHKIHIFLIQFFTKQLNRFAETLEMDDFPFPQELDHIIYIRIIGQAEDIVIGDSGLLLWYVGLFTTIFSSLFENK